MRITSASINKAWLSKTYYLSPCADRLEMATGRASVEGRTSCHLFQVQSERSNVFCHPGWGHQEACCQPQVAARTRQPDDQCFKRWNSWPVILEMQERDSLGSQVPVVFPGNNWELCFCEVSRLCTARASGTRRGNPILSMLSINRLLKKHLVTGYTEMCTYGKCAAERVSNTYQGLFGSIQNVTSASRTLPQAPSSHHPQWQPLSWPLTPQTWFTCFCA